MAARNLVAVAAALLAMVLAVPARADTTEQNRQFLTGLRSAGWAITDADVLIGKAHQICNEGLGHGVTVQEMHSTLVGWGHSSKDATTLIRQAVDTYCPQYSAALNGFNAPSPVSAGPTNADGYEFADEVHDYGILRNLDPRILVSTLATICDQANDGEPKNWIVASYMNGWGLSQRDATWLVNAAIAKCK